jgi:putative acetyltransferase
MTVRIEIDDPRRDDVLALLRAHWVFAQENTPPEDVHALDLAGLLDPSVTFFSARRGAELVGIGALKRLDASHAELKSMHTVATARGSGVGRAMVEHLLAFAQEHGYARVSLETGAMESFAPARALYARAGFVECEPFGAYVPSRNSTFMTRAVGPT